MDHISDLRTVGLEAEVALVRPESGARQTPQLCHLLERQGGASDDANSRLPSRAVMTRKSARLVEQAPQVGDEDRALACRPHQVSRAR